MEGITLDIMQAALLQARAGRQHILQQMADCDPPPTGKLSAFAPRIHRMTVDTEKLGQLIGSGGRNIRALEKASGCDSISVSFACHFSSV